MQAAIPLLAERKEKIFSLTSPSYRAHWEGPRVVYQRTGQLPDGRLTFRYAPERPTTGKVRVARHPPATSKG
jgi:hypothetical protein